MINSNILNSRKHHLKVMLEKLFLIPHMPQMDRWIASECAKHKNFGSKDRKWYTEQVFVLIRKLYQILYLEKYSSLSLDDFNLKITNPTLFWTEVRTIPIEKMIVHLESCDTIKPDHENVLYCANIPAWFELYLLRRFSNHSHLKHFCDLQQTRPKLWIRINDDHHIQTVLSDLENHSCQCSQSDHINTFSVETQRSILGTDSFNCGLFEIQDYASQLIGFSLNVKPNEYIWDVCAGGGGKTIQIASMLKNTGVIYASDIRNYKLSEIKRRAKKSKFTNIQTFEHDATEVFSLPQDVKMHGGFDHVFIDAPCTSSGTWRRQPDKKFRISKEDISELSNLQFNILNTVKTNVKVFGQLVYATCSVFLEENEDIVQKFLAQNPNFNLNMMSVFGNDHSDTMFVAVMEKIS